MNPNLAQRAAAEAVGTTLLLAAVVGSGIMGERLASGNIAIVLLANSIATGAALLALILTFSGISGAHFNPVITLSEAWERGLSWNEVTAYLIAQVVGAFSGVAIAHLMFGMPLFSVSHRDRSGSHQMLSEFVATFGLVCVVRSVGKSRSTAVPFAVAGYIVAAYWFTASTSFANPAVTLARSVSDTFAGIQPADTPAFIAAQLLGALTATALLRWLIPKTSNACIVNENTE